MTASPPYIKLIRKRDIINNYRTTLHGSESQLPKQRIARANKEDKEDKDDKEEKEDKEEGDYNYLLNMSIRSFSSDTLIKLTKERDAALKAYADLEHTEPHDIWLNELAKLEREYKQEVIDWIAMNKLTIIEPRIKVAPVVKPPAPAVRVVVRTK
jgi:hypothetical protein